VPQGAREAIAAIVRTIFAQPDHASAMTQLRKVADGLRGRFPRTAALLGEAAEDVLAYRHLPLEHQRQIHSTNPLERLNKEIKRRSNVVGIFPNPAPALRLVGAISLEQDDEWAVARTSLLQRGIDDAADDADPVGHGARDLGGDCVSGGVGAR
jgi:transposase-like protein